MRYFIDTEFMYGAGKSDSMGGFINPLSVGIVAEDGREYYMVVEEVINAHFLGYMIDKWFADNICGNLARDDNDFIFEDGKKYLKDDLIKPRAGIAQDIKDFIGEDTPQFWGDYSAFDYVVLTTIMGGMDKWPSGWPMYICDMQQDAIPTIESKQPHNALADARAVRDAWNWAFQIEAGESPCA